MLDQTAAVEEPPLEAMPDYELVSYLSQHESSAIGYFQDEISDEQKQAIDYYYRRMPDLPAQEGCSSVVDGTVAIVIDNALASILKPFVSSDETVSFAPRGPEDEETAAQATEYVNFVFNNDNNGFMLLHHWFKDALLTKLGIVKAWWNEETRIVKEQVQVADEMQVAMLAQSEPVSDVQPQEDGTFIVTIAREVSDGRVKIENIPPEEFQISPFTRTLKEATYCAHVPANVSRSDLIEMGFDPEVVDTLPGAPGTLYVEGNESGRRDARYQDERFGGGIDANGTPHKSQEIVQVRDEYVRIDYDGDGIAELRRVVRVDSTILLNEEVDCLPFAVLCPVPMPHKVYGLSLADQTIDLQRISTVIWRQTLDNLYKSNNPRPIIGEGAERQDGSTGDSIADSAPGAGIYVRDPTQFDYGAVPFTADKSFTMLEYVEQQQEARTGIGRSGQGLDTNALRKSGQMTATEIAQITSGKNARAEMIARIFAETGVKDLFKLILKLVTRYQTKERVIRLRNQWVPIDPSGWPVDMDVEVSVGLGMGNKMENIAQADSILETMAMLVQSPFASLITPEKAYNAVKRKFVAAGVKNVDDLLSDPEQNPIEEGPDPEQQAMEAEMAMQQAKLQAEMQMQQAKIAGEQELARIRLEIQREEAAAKQQLERERAEFEAQLARDKAQFEADLAVRKMEIQRDIEGQKLSQNRAGGQLDQ